MLVWLASTVPAVGQAVVRLALEAVDGDATPEDAWTQHGIAGGRLDAVLASPPAFIVVVESKLGSGYGEGQLRKYMDWLATNHGDCVQRALMTVTKRPEPWPASDQAHAAEIDIVAAPRQWADLHAVLQVIADESEEGVATRLLRDFVEMLADEGLVAVEPLAEHELTDAWRRSVLVIEHFRAYFRGCQDALAEALHAQPATKRQPPSPQHVYCDFVTPSSEWIGVGIDCYDGELTPRAKPVQNKPIIWLAVEAEAWGNWSAVRPWLDAHPPEHWTVNRQGKWGRAMAWRYLSDVAGLGSLDSQRTGLVAAASDARAWLEAARDACPPPPAGRRLRGRR